MAKQKYLTEYPAILKEKAKNAGVKIKKADYRFLDCFMNDLEKTDYRKLQIDLMEESEEVMIDFTTDSGESVCVLMDAHDARVVNFKAKTTGIPGSYIDSVGKSILTGKFIDNYLSLQITLENLEKPFADIVMEGNLWIDCLGEEAAGGCSLYLSMFIEQIDQINDVLSEMGAEMGYGVRLTDYGLKKVEVVKKVQELTGWGLKEAIAFVSAAPDAVLRVGSLHMAMHFLSEFAEIDVKAEIA